MLFNGTRLLGLVSAVVFSLASPAVAGEAWRVVDTAGTVKAGGAGFMPVALTRDQTLPSDAWVETAAGARAVLARGQETIVVEPNSRVQLPDEEVNGNTQVLQTLGSAFYKIGKQKKPHFQVDTPYLAAVVKGTQFTVSVEDGEASVTVTEGLVQVSTPDGKDTEFVPPGFTATVGEEDKGDVVVKHSPRNENASGAPTNDGGKANNGGSTEQEKGKSEHTVDSGKPVVIPVTVGSIDIDVKEVSGGLAYGELKTASVDAGSTGKVTEDTGKVDDPSKNAKNDLGGAAETETPKGQSDASLTPSLAPGDGIAPVTEASPGNGNGGSVGGGDTVVTVPDLGNNVPTVEPGDIGERVPNGNGNAGGNGNGNGRRPEI